MKSPVEFKKFKRSTLMQSLLDQKIEDESSQRNSTKSDERTKEDHFDDYHVMLSTCVKKRNRFGLFFKRRLTLTDQPKLYYYKDTKGNSPDKIIDLDQHTKIERLDRIKFKITVLITLPNKTKKEDVYVFKC